MKINIYILLVYSFLFLLISCSQIISIEKNKKTKYYGRYINNLSESNTDKEVEYALKFLRKAGTNAFDSLTANLNNQNLAKFDFFQKQIIHQKKDGTWETYRPKIGDVCFDILQEQIEGKRPKLYKKYYQLNETNIKDWWYKNKNRSINILRIDLIKKAIKQAKQANDIKAVIYFEKKLEEKNNKLRNP